MKYGTISCIMGIFHSTTNVWIISPCNKHFIFRGHGTIQTRQILPKCGWGWRNRTICNRRSNISLCSVHSLASTTTIRWRICRHCLYGRKIHSIVNTFILLGQMFNLSNYVFYREHIDWRKQACFWATDGCNAAYFLLDTVSNPGVVRAYRPKDIFLLIPI